LRFRSIRLSWFRGAADSAEIGFSEKSLAIFGANGAGKSSFVDAVEAIISGGKVGHLAHEYSGRNQEFGLINTARPPGRRSEVEITLADGSTESIVWNMGSPTCRKIGSTSVAHWDYRCIALRQEELSEFIRATKGTKYNGILPLLGLSCLELAAGNVHKLVQSIERQCNINELKSKVSLSLNRCNDLIGNKTRDRIFSRLDELRIIHDSENPVESQIATAKNILHSITSAVPLPLEKSAIVIFKFASTEFLLPQKKLQKLRSL
jgi:DNA repair exonuclease SbcCD ATPase subunit